MNVSSRDNPLLYPPPASRTTHPVTAIPLPNVRRTVAGQPLRLGDELRDLVQHRHLLVQLIHRDLTIRYKRSVLGFLWTMLHPLLMMLIFLVVFSNMFRFATPHYETYFLSEYIAWMFFAQTVTQVMASVAWNGPLMKRVRVPPSIFTLAATVSGLVNLLLSILMLFVIMLIAGAPFRITLLFLPVSLLIVAAFTFGISLALAAFSVFFADVREMIQAALPALMYLTPIIYPISIVPDLWRPMLAMNPLAYVLEIVRDPIYYGILPSHLTLILAIVMSIGSVAFGWMIFSRLAPRFHAHV
jgi:ABC-type polysaccharide/polyol phosphate export permease